MKADNSQGLLNWLFQKGFSFVEGASYQQPYQLPLWLRTNTLGTGRGRQAYLVGLLVSTAAAVPAWAQPLGESAEPALGASPVLYVEHSRPGESMDDFVRRISVHAERVANGKNREVCGLVERAAGGFRIQMRLGDGNTHCQLAGEEPMVTFHVHLDFGGGQFSPRDYDQPGYMTRRGRLCYQEGRGREALVTRYGRRGGSVCADSGLARVPQ